MGEHDEQLVFEMGYNKGFKDGIKGSIPKDQYKTDMVAILEEMQQEIVEITIPKATVLGEIFWDMGADAVKKEIETRIQQKINELRGEEK